MHMGVKVMPTFLVDVSSAAYIFHISGHVISVNRYRYLVNNTTNISNDVY